MVDKDVQTPRSRLETVMQRQLTAVTITLMIGLSEHANRTQTIRAHGGRIPMNSECNEGDA